ncbi:YHYH protein [Flavobacteriaceae bacterium]|nr:YHYH protein [Flavobacteriaceae bacterium]MDC1167454.1 YHYH protein [Flavobacteriaceae bacterium]
MKFLKTIFKIHLFSISILCTLGCSGDESSSIIDDDEVIPITNYDITSILSKFNSTGMTIEINANSVVFNTNDLPDHKSPYYLDTEWESELYELYNGTNPQFNLNPNRIAEQNITFTIPLFPEESSNHRATNLGPIGIARNGVVFFNQYAAGNSPLTNEINSFDQYLGHPAGMGNYHYHVEPTYLTEQFGNNVFLGLLADGFPVYGPFENGSEVTNNDLDEFHGHLGATVDFPDGIYHYHVTSQDPYINGNGYFGTPGNISQ